MVIDVQFAFARKRNEWTIGAMGIARGVVTDVRFTFVDFIDDKFITSKENYLFIEKKIVSKEL